jgi:type IV pilus assembly protein PilW
MMKAQIKFNQQGAQCGRTLIEVMIALTIGLVILIAITALFAANRQSYRTSDDKTRLDEEGRLALNLMAFHTRMSGYGTLLNTRATRLSLVDSKLNVPTVTTNFDFDDPDSPFRMPTSVALMGCANGFVTPGAGALACNGGVGNDAFMVSYVFDPAAAAVDCLGAAVLPNAAGVAIVDNRFFIQNNPNTGFPELYCQGNGGTVAGGNLVNPPQPIAENVEQMVITYGISVPPNNGQSVNRMVRANQLLTADDWDRVVSSRICIVVRSANDNIATQAQQYTNCNNVLVNAPDRRLRQVFSTTVTMRRKAAGAI